MSLTNNTTLKNMNYNGEKVKKWIHNGVQVFSAGSTVTYVVDSGVSYTEEVDSGASCLSPTTFTPSKDGWTFVGWREDTTASGSVLSSKVMESEPITLYAVYAKTITANFYSGWYPDTRVLNTPTGIAYYNAAGNIQNAQITAPTGTGISGWTWRGWSNWYDGTANGDVNLNNGDIFYVHPDNDGITLLGLYQKTITAHFISGIGGTNTQDVQGTSYYNSSGNVTTIDITAPSGASATGWTWRGWSKYWTGDATAVVFLANGGTTTINHTNDGITYYGLYYQKLTVYFDGNGATGGSTSSLYPWRYHNSCGNTENPTITLPSNGFSRIGYTFNGWDLGAVGASITLSASTTAYAQWTAANYVVYSASHNSVTNNTTSVTGHSVSVNDTGFVTVSPQYFSDERGSGGNSNMDGSITIKNASAHSRVVVEYDVRQWKDYGYTADVRVDGTLVNNYDYTKWYSKSVEKSLSSGAATISWTVRMEDQDGFDGAGGGCHIVITKVTIYP